MPPQKENGEELFLCSWQNAKGVSVAFGVGADATGARKSADRECYKWDKKNPLTPVVGFKLSKITVPA